MRETPEGWARTQLGEIADLQLGKMLDRARNVGQPTPYLRNINVRWGSFDLDDLLTVPLSDGERERFEIRDGDVLVCEGGEPGRAAVWRAGSTEIKYQKAIHRVRLAKGIKPELLSLFMRHLSNERLLQDHFTGTTIKHLPREVFCRLVVPVPPLPEQRRIVAKLDRLSTRSRAARDHLARTAKLAARAKRAILAAAFRGELTEEDRPRSDGHLSRTRLLHEIAKISSGGTPKGIADQLTPDGEIRWFKVSSMNEVGNEKELRASQFRLSSQAAKLLSLRLFPAGTIVFPKRGGAIATNKKRVLAMPSAVDLNLMALVARETVDAKYLRFWVEGLDLSEISNGSNVPQINYGDVANLMVPLPSLEVQEAIVRRIEAAFARIDRLTAEAARAAHLLDRLDERLLAKAFRGELVPQDPADEPAEVLLARIRAARDAAPRPRRGRRSRAAA